MLPRTSSMSGRSRFLSGFHGSSPLGMDGQSPLGPVVAGSAAVRHGPRRIGVAVVQNEEKQSAQLWVAERSLADRTVAPAPQ